MCKLGYNMMKASVAMAVLGLALYVGGSVWK